MRAWWWSITWRSGTTWGRWRGARRRSASRRWSSSAAAMSAPLAAMAPPRTFASVTSSLSRSPAPTSRQAGEQILASPTPKPYPFASFLPDMCFFVSLQDERGCDICGVEITDDAQPVTAHPFRRSTAFLFGNEVGRILRIQHRFYFFRVRCDLERKKWWYRSISWAGRKIISS